MTYPVESPTIQHNQEFYEKFRANIDNLVFNAEWFIENQWKKFNYFWDSPDNIDVDKRLMVLLDMLMGEKGANITKDEEIEGYHINLQVRQN